jgi:tetratricopeptide (TPR) repeat protein
VEFRPDGAPVHHAVIRLDRGRTSRTRDGADGQPGFDGMMSPHVRDPDGHFVGWAPGRGPIVAPDGLPWAIDADSDLVVELHLLPGRTAIDVRPVVGVFFADRAPSASPVLFVMGSKTIDIPAGARGHAVEDAYELPVDARVLSVYPHAHYLGREMTVTATSPGGAAQTLLHIPRWSFHWQQDYRYATPVSLRRGTRIAMRFTYDNSKANADNPSDPPRRVTWGPEASDEMGNVGIQLVTTSAADAATLTTSFARHAAEIDLAGARLMARADPDNAAHAEAIGTALTRLGRFAEAVPALEQAVALDPDSAGARNHLGGALLGAGRAAEALARFREASSLAPEDAHLRYNYARVLADAGDQAAARAELARAVALAPDFGEAHQLLGALLFAAGRTQDALPHLRAAVERMPDSAAAHSDYGGALAAIGRFDAASLELRRALQIDPAYAPARDNLDRLARRRPR